MLMCLNGNRYEVVALAFSPSNKFFATAANGMIRIFSLQTKQEMFQFDHKVSTQCHEGHVHALQWYTDEFLLSGGSDSDLKCYRLTDGEVHVDEKLVTDSA